jgi:uncharacterized Zn-binding protein involved in type VI secretion
MPEAARIDDTIIGNFTSEHNGHYDRWGTPYHNGGSLTGKISVGSSNVFINGKSAATMNSKTEENDVCCGTSYGSVSGGSSTVFVNGKPIARKGDAISAHNGTATINSSSPNVFIGG